MNDATLLGPWVKRFLLEHIVQDRNLARNTQQSYRDTLVQLVPFVAKIAGRPVERLNVVDITPAIVRLFLNDIETTPGVDLLPEISGSQQYTPWPSILDQRALSISSGVGKSGLSPSRRLADLW